jgi:hypothetical protein
MEFSLVINNISKSEMFLVVENDPLSIITSPPPVAEVSPEFL